ncbi:MAG: GIY-YIG nuclease family protein [Flammeovirgaceae bacterium]|nr:GIY-YIG nuclease family protein [Flammeovirgaceae bacterium]
MYFVYILQSQKNSSFYKGSTNNLSRRVAEHNAAKDFSTARFIPWNLVWFTQKPSKSQAMVLEKKIKNLSIERTLSFILKYPSEKVPGIKIEKPIHP